jgi:predicted dehydrogenase
LTRRQFLAGSAATTALSASGCISLWEERPLPPDEQPRIACIGVGGRGWVDAQRIAAAGARVTAICDVDITPPKWFFFMTDVAKRFPDARFFRDYREMIGDSSELFDAVVISTPDHHHEHAAVLAMRRGKHVYCQKPLSRTLAQAETMERVARETGAITQMGNQGHARDHLRRAVELVQAGAIGRVEQVHCWTNRPIWPQGMTKRPEPAAVPKDLDWDLWLGPAPERPYGDGYHPFDWRGWWDFGTGALGDMGCHILDLPAWSLGLGPPARVSATSLGATEEAAPTESTVTLGFDNGPDVIWYDGGRLPPAEVREPLGLSKRQLRRHDCLLVGSDGALVFDHIETLELTGGADASALEDVPRTLPRVVNEATEWIDAIRGVGPQPLSGFERAGPFTRLVLAGNAAIRAGRALGASELRGPDGPAPRPGWG